MPKPHLVDLHSHTNLSDGVLTPRALVELAYQRGLRYLAVTDHDSTAGIAEAIDAARDCPGLTLIPGIEISCDIPGHEVHLLGYFLDYQDPELQLALTRMRQNRVGRAQKMLEILASLDMPLDWERVQAIAGDASIGRPHVAEALLERGYVDDLREAFDRYLGNGRPAYVERDKLTPVDAIRQIRNVGGLPVLAHPTYVGDFEALLPELVQAGLVGMEVYYSKYPPETVDRLRRVADRFGLVPCGGSDYHGRFEGEIGPGEAYVPVETYERLWALRG